MLIANISAGLLGLGERVTQDQMLRALRTGFHTEQGTHEAWAYILVGIGLIGLFGIGLQIWRRSRAAAEMIRSDHFRTALNLLGLQVEDRTLLTQIRSKCGLAEPVSMLMSPANFAHALARSGMGSDSRQAGRAAELCQRLFDRPLPAVTDPAIGTPDSAHFVRES